MATKKKKPTTADKPVRKSAAAGSKKAGGGKARSGRARSPKAKTAGDTEPEKTSGVKAEVDAAATKTPTVGTDAAPKKSRSPKTVGEAAPTETPPRKTRGAKAAAGPKKKKASDETAQPSSSAPANPEEVAASSNGSTPPARTGQSGPAFPNTEYAVVEKLLVGFLECEIGKVGVKRAVLGLSGGIDSAVSAAIAARALGPDNVLGVMMPYQSSSPESLGDAREVAASLGIETMVVEITEQIDRYFEGFPDASRLRRGNKMARERMTILYDHSAARSALVIGTSNKTELLLGYGTLYGDMASALNPIGDLYKTQVWGFARHLGLPPSVIDKAPTADLWTGQTDETELGFSYHDVDRLLYRMIDERCDREELVWLGFDAEFVDRISRMVRSSQFKRRLPVIAKLSARSIDTDFRYSRDWGL